MSGSGIDGTYSTFNGTVPADHKKSWNVENPLPRSALYSLLVSHAATEVSRTYLFTDFVLRDGAKRRLSLQWGLDRTALTTHYQAEGHIIKLKFKSITSSWRFRLDLQLDNATDMSWHEHVMACQCLLCLWIGAVAPRSPWLQIKLRQTHTLSLSFIDHSDYVS